MWHPRHCGLFPWGFQLLMGNRMATLDKTFHGCHHIVVAAVFGVRHALVGKGVGLQVVLNQFVFGVQDCTEALRFEVLIQDLAGDFSITLQQLGVGDDSIEKGVW